MRTRFPRSIFLLTLALSSAAGSQRTQLKKSKAADLQFTRWYPQYRDTFSTILKDSCQEPYQNYLSGWINESRIDWHGGGDMATALVQPVMLCILDHTNDYIKSAMASAQVLLGLTPTFLAFMSPTAQEIAMLSIISRRSVLSYLMIFCSPVTHLGRLFEYDDPIKHFEGRRGRCVHRPSSALGHWINAAQYLFGVLGIFNVVQLYTQLGSQTVCAWWPNDGGGIALFGALNLVAWFGGSLLLAFQLQLANSSPDEGPSEQPRIRRWRKSLLRYILAFRLDRRISICQTNIHVRAFPERKRFIAVYWFLSVCFLVHLAYGSLLLSSLFFIGPRDALGVVGRFVASAFVSRVIVSYELAGLRANVTEIIAIYGDDQPLITYRTAVGDTTVEAEPDLTCEEGSVGSHPLQAMPA